MRNGVQEMADAMDFLAPVLAQNAKLGVKDEGDYYDEEGLLVCGKCHTRRQMKINVPTGNGKDTREIKVFTQCKCRQEAEEMAKAERHKAEEADARERQIRELKRLSLMDARLSGNKFSLFQKTDENARNLKLCLRYAEHFDEMLKKNQGLLMYGTVGTGKSFSAACIANHLLDEGISVMMTSFVRILEVIQGGRESDEATLDQMNRVQLLIIDDLGAERGTDFALEKVYNVIDSRYRAKLPIILTTNLTLEEMKNETEPRYERIYDRIFEMCYPMRYAGLSWRKREANRRYEDMKAFLEG